MFQRRMFWWRINNSIKATRGVLISSSGLHVIAARDNTYSNVFTHMGVSITVIICIHLATPVVLKNLSWKLRGFWKQIGLTQTEASYTHGRLTQSAFYTCRGVVYAEVSYTSLSLTHRFLRQTDACVRCLLHVRREGVSKMQTKVW